MIETWQADPDGRFDHSDDPRGASAEWAERGFTGFARASTDDGGSFEIVTVKPGPLPFGDGRRRRRTSTSPCSPAACSTAA